MDDAELTRRLARIARRRCLNFKGGRPKDLESVEPVGISGPNLGASLQEDEVEFGRAMHAWQILNRRMPTTRDVLAVAVQLGYVKVDESAVITPS